MTGPIRPDDDLDDLGPDLDALAARYHAASEGIEPPQHLDAQLVAAAHRAVDAKPRAPGAALVYPSSFARRMRVPFGLAATIVAVASITVALWKESPEKLAIPSDHAPETTSPKAERGDQATSSGAVAVTVMPARQAAPSPEISEAAPAPFIAPPPVRRKAQEESRGLQSPHTPAALAAPAVPSSGKTQPSDAKARSAAGEPEAKVASKSEQSLDRITVTGSNLKRADTETPSPVQVITLQPREPSPTSAASAPSAPAQPVAPPAPAPLAAVAALPSHDAVPATPPPAPISVPPPVAYSAPPSTPGNAPPVSVGPAPAAPVPPPAPRLAARSVEPTPNIAQPAPPAATAAPAPSIETAKPSDAPEVAAAPSAEAASLLAALQTAADAGDTVAANSVLDALKNNYPHVQIRAALRVQLIRLGVAVPQAR